MSQPREQKAPSVEAYCHVTDPQLDIFGKESFLDPKLFSHVHTLDITSQAENLSRVNGIFPNVQYLVIRGPRRQPLYIEGSFPRLHMVMFVELDVENPKDVLQFDISKVKKMRIASTRVSSVTTIKSDDFPSLVDLHMDWVHPKLTFEGLFPDLETLRMIDPSKVTEDSIEIKPEFYIILRDLPPRT